MNTDAKLVAAAKRAARKISHADGIPHQAALDRVAREAGRGTWSAFLASPVPIDQASAEAGAEPDFTEVSPDAHLLAAIDYGITIGARALMARPAGRSGSASIVYCSARSEEYDRPIDPRGLSVAAMITALASTPKNDRGHAIIQDGQFAFEIDDLDGGGRLRMSMDDTLPPSAPLTSGPELEERQASRRHQRLMLRASKVAEVPFVESFDDPGDVLDSLVILAWETSRADVLFEVNRDTVDAYLQIGDTRRLVHVMSSEDYRLPLAMAKDRGRVNPMEWRIPQHGGWSMEIGSALREIHIATEPTGTVGCEHLRIGFTSFPKKAYARPPSHEIPEGGRLLLGEHGLFSREKVRAKPGSLIVVSGGRGSGRTSRYVVPAILDGTGADVIVSDMAGTLPERLGNEWARYDARIHLDPRIEPARRAPAFNPFHPNMMPSGHVAAAEWIAATLILGDTHVHDAARSLLIGIVDVAIHMPETRADCDRGSDVATLPMIARWIKANADRIDDLQSLVTGPKAVAGQGRLRRFLTMSEMDRRTTIATLWQALSFVESQGMERILAPADEDRGADLASALVLRRTPALVVVGGNAEAGQGRLCALVMQAAIHLRDGFALREAHLYVDDAEQVGPMPWLRKAIASPHGTSAVVVLEGPHQIDGLAPRTDDGRTPGISHWLVEQITEPADRERIADAMGVRHSKVTAHRADRRRIVIDAEGVRMLRR